MSRGLEDEDMNQVENIEQALKTIKKNVESMDEKVAAYRELTAMIKYALRYLEANQPVKATEILKVSINSF